MKGILRGLYKKICSDMKGGSYFFISLFTLIFCFGLNFSSAGLITQNLVLTNENIIKGVSYTPINDTWVYIKSITGIIKAGSRECSQVRLNTANYLQASCGGYTMNESLTNFKFSSGSYYFECVNGQNCDGFSLNIGGFTFDYTFIDTGSSCSYSGYVLESDITENYCTDKFSNLIDESDITSSYCEDNNLCPSVSTGDSNWSSLYINDIQHLGSSSIFITIPEEFNWYYNYLDSGMYIDIEGYNVDYDKINDIISVQNYKPDSDDFSNLVRNVLPLFVPGLVIILFIYFIFRFIKKIFK